MKFKTRIRLIKRKVAYPVVHWWIDDIIVET